MAFSIKFNDIELSDIVDGFTSIQRDTGGGFTTNLQSSNGAPQTTRYGQDFLFNTVNTKTITVNYILHGNLSDWALKRNQIASILNVTEPSPLIFGDEPNKVWYAVADGNQTLTEDLTTMTATGVLTFLVPSGISESTYTQTLNSENSGGENGTITKNSDGSYSALINNQGSLETFPTVKITLNDYDGYLGIVNQSGTFEMGSVDQYINTDKTVETIKHKSEWLLNGKLSDVANFTDFADSKDTNAQNPALKTDGTLEFMNDGLRLSTIGNSPGVGTWLTQGGYKKYTIPSDSNNITGAQYFSSYSNFFAWAGALGQTGLAQVLYTDSNGKLICGFGIYKDDMKGNTAHAQFYIGGNTPGTFRSFDFTANNDNVPTNTQKAPNKNFNSGTGGVTITKYSGGNFYFNLSAASAMIKVPELENTKCAYIYVYVGQIRDIPFTAAKFVSNLSVREVNFRKDDVNLYVDSTINASKFVPGNPKFYKNGEIILVDMSASKIYTKDGKMPSNDQLITGANFLSLPRGISEMDFYFSDEMKVAPKIEVSWKERYL